MKPAFAALFVLACGAPAAAPREAAPVAADPDEVRVAADASMADLLAGLRRSLAARGHDEGECFLAWDVDAAEQITVHVGERSRSAALSCGGLDASLLEGRCVFLRVFWVTGEELRTEAITFYFAPAGRAYAARPIGGVGVGAPAAEALFDDDQPEGVRLVLGVPLRSRAPVETGAPTRGATMTPPRDNPLQNPEIAEAVQQLVARIQECNDEESGSLVLEWTIDGAGDVHDVRPLTATVSDDAARCATEILEEVSFPGHDGSEPVDFCVPVMLDPELRRER